MPPPINDRLPITAILPCKNNRADLPAHVEGMREWASAVKEIVVVDSSEDGSLDYLRKEFEQMEDIFFHPRPPGLYAAWNHGVTQSSGSYIYYSTVGDKISL